MHSPIEISSDHASFPGHFPDFPVLAGAVLLDEVLPIMQRAWNIDLTLWHIASAKFLGAERLFDALSLEHHAPESGFIRFTIRTAGRTIASGSMRSATPGRSA